MLTLLMQVYPDTDVITLRSHLRERILTEAASKLGVAEQIQGLTSKSQMHNDAGLPVDPIEEQSKMTRHPRKAPPTSSCRP